MPQPIFIIKSDGTKQIFDEKKLINSLQHVGAAPAAIEARLVRDGLAFYAPLGESAGNVLAVSVAGQPRPVTLGSEPAWDTGVTAAKAFKSKPEVVMEVAGAGDFERDQAFEHALVSKKLGVRRLGTGPGARGPGHGSARVPCAVHRVLGARQARGDEL